MLPYHVQVTHVLDCSYVASLQYNFTISDHSEPIVPYGVMADWLFSAQLVGKIARIARILVISIKQINAILFFLFRFKKIASKIDKHIMISYLLLYNKHLDFDFF